MKKIELLVPVGSLANLKAAVVSGADAVYLGMLRFGARTHARNFSRDYLKKAIEICKSNNVKIFLTMNTLVKNKELYDFFKQLEFAYVAGIDAVIIQDPSFMNIIKHSFPGLKIHMSTQTGVLNSNHANLFKQANRINLARELSKQNIESIRKNFNKELEIFVHGALCVSISGSCLFSGLLGGRSGNRGKCAQPCRKLYGENYYLSTKELSLIEKLPKIIQSNIDSIKIEGRMRTPYYVATTTSVYRNAIDSYYSGNFKITQEVLDKLKTAFSRDFTEGGYSSESVFNRKTAEGSSDIQEQTYEVKTKEIHLGFREANIALPKIKETPAKQKQLLVRVYSKQDAIAACENGADIIYLDLFHKDFQEIKKQINCSLYAVTPRIMLDSDISEITKEIKEKNPEGLLAGNLGILNLNLKLPIHLDYNSNCFNDYSLQYLESLNALPIISPELSTKEQIEFKNKNFITFVHGKIRLMTLAHKLDKKSITDEKGFTFYINQIKNGSEILNEKELGLFNKAKNLLRAGITRFYIDTETNVGEVTNIYRQILDGKTIDVSKLKQDYVLGWSDKGVL